MKDAVQKSLENIAYPGFKRSIVSFGVIKDIEVTDDVIKVTLQFSTANETVIKEIKDNISETLAKAFSDKRVYLQEIPSKDKPAGAPKASADDPWAGKAPIPGIKRIIAVASGKGGVGKSTVATNLAMSLSKNGLKVGLLDSDIYGPSIHIMMGIDMKPAVDENEKLIPAEKHGIKMISMGMFLDEMTPVIWRGPMVMKAVEQFLDDVSWGHLDVLVIDLPPGTGDAQLTLVQKVPVDGAIIVTTPQEVALVDARRGLKMFDKVHTDVWGIIENMSYFVAPDTGNKYYIFGNNGGKVTAEQLHLDLLGQIPIEAIVTESGDSGTPVVALYPESKTAEAFNQVADTLLKKLNL